MDEKVNPHAGVEAILLGTAQDAGLPQAGCSCPNCARARTHASHRAFTACLALVDHAARRSWLIDATPDFREQLHALDCLAPGCPLSGILLTHAHVGHYTGLMHLGREAMNTRGLPVYATARMAAFLRGNGPWSQLVGLGNIELRPLEPGVETRLSDALGVLPVLVPHRDELSDTVAFVVRGPARRLFYCPDIDAWDAWEHDLRGFAAEMDAALLDGTFYDADELPHRDMSEIGHPPALDTAARLEGVESEGHERMERQVRLIHLNHGNPLHDEGAPQRRELARRGIEVGRFGERWVLG